jgi:hypothetical protein
MKTVCPELNPITMPYGFESFWEYDVLPNSPAAKAAPEFEKIRNRAIALLSKETVQEDVQGEGLGAARKAVTAS